MQPKKAEKLTQAIMKKINANPLSKTIDETVLKVLEGEIYSALREEQ